ncbi:MAG: type IV pilus secretin PilQ [Thermoanaerobaculia bacterium]
MKKAKRVLLIACMLALSIGGAQASLFRRKAAEKTPAAAAPSALSLTAVEVETEPSSRLVLRTSGSPAYTSYSPQPDVFVVEMAGTSKAGSVAVPPLPSSIAAVRVEEVTEMGARLTRVTVQLAHPGVLQAAAEGSTIAITLPAVAVAQASVEVPAAGVTATVSEPAPAALLDVSAASPEPTVSSEPIPSRLATVLRKIDTAGSGDAMAVELATNGDVRYKAFKLDKPSRLVIDLQGVTDRLSKNVIAVDGSSVRKIRVSQFKSSPDAVTRVVLDLNDSAPYRVTKSGDRLRISFGSSAPMATAPARPAVTVTQGPATTASGSQGAGSPERTTALDVPSQVSAIAENASVWKMPEAPTRRTRSVINAQTIQTAPAPSARKRRGGAGTSAATRANTSAPVVPATVASEDVFNEAQTVGQATTPGGTNPTLSGSLSGRTLTAGEKVYTGEPISLNLKDADIKDVIRTFAQLTGLNIAVDPQVSGSVTVDFVDVPWDQALEIILRQNNLSYVLEGNVMRIGTIDRLSLEATSSRKLAEEERLNVTLQTVSFKLSYARANEVAGLLRDIASPRAKIIVDARTNQLIISEIPGYLQTIRSLIESVDVATRQVVIEARIVETSKLFIQQYGINFGFRTRLDPSLGTGTGLIFPNRVDAVGGPFNFGPGNPVLSFSLTDVLGTFTLDLALNALEQEGLVRVISAPRVMTQDNTPAEIQSGFQIPYQTRVNFTTTVAYVDATLRLQVTPQITEAGTVIMDISVQKNEPATGFRIEGGAGVPLSTRQAKTRLMVRDGGTSVIAGIYQTKENKAETRLPILGQIPFIGNLFKTHDINNTHDELLIFITPRIVRSS